MSLLTLVKRAQNNDESAMVEIIERFEPKIRKSLKFTDIGVREDIHQDIIFRMIKAVKSYRMANEGNRLIDREQL
ncbi:helix-turn-helix domain-containing protein [Brevibacillus sp. Leaf182]|uniref:helix-turn-helix domain-containing protein n=1 Tax=Brevibacillus sp. Leaf182 TaxID=1736290 RepID=UPI0006F946BD|nr:helix-turn-helix domain-containing protein [Brevibacillus sp. Leaf182]